MAVWTCELELDEAREIVAGSAAALLPPSGGGPTSASAPSSASTSTSTRVRPTRNSCAK